MESITTQKEQPVPPVTSAPAVLSNTEHSLSLNQSAESGQAVKQQLPAQQETQADTEADNKIATRQAVIIDSAIELMEHDYHWEIAQLRDAVERIPAFQTRDLIFEKNTQREWERIKARVGETRKKWPGPLALTDITGRALRGRWGAAEWFKRYLVGYRLPQPAIATDEEWYDLVEEIAESIVVEILKHGLDGEKVAVDRLAYEKWRDDGQDSRVISFCADLIDPGGGGVRSEAYGWRKAKTGMLKATPLFESDGSEKSHKTPVRGSNGNVDGQAQGQVPAKVTGTWDSSQEREISWTDSEKAKGIPQKIARSNNLETSQKIPEALADELAKQVDSK
jgi:hypothetical protein